MKLQYTLIIFVFLSFCFLGKAQEKPLNKKSGISKQPVSNSSIRSLTVGENVPDILITKIINDDRRNAKISDFKDQLLILDFWDTYCGSCIEALPKLHDMQIKFGNKIKILAVTYQQEAEVSNFFNKNRFLKGLKFPCVVEDNILRAYFRHQIISHEVWIFKGRVIAITTPEYVNIENITKVLNGEKINWPIKSDSFNFDPKQEIFALKDPDKYSNLFKIQEHSGITGYRPGIDYKEGIAINDDSVKHVYRTSFYNSSIIKAYSQLLFQSDSNKRNFIMTPGRIVLEVKDTSNFMYDSKSGLIDSWNYKNLFCYEMVSSKPLKKTERMKKVLQDLDLKLSLHGRWGKRMVNCIIIYKANPNINPDSVSKPIKPTMALPLSAVPLMGFDMSQEFPPAIDETGYKGTIYLGTYSGKGSIRKELQRYGFDYKEELRNIEVMIITEI